MKKHVRFCAHLERSSILFQRKIFRAERVQKNKILCVQYTFSQVKSQNWRLMCISELLYAKTARLLRFIKENEAFTSSTYIKSHVSPFHAMKAYGGSGSTTPFILKLGTVRRWVVCFTPRSIYFQGKSPLYSWSRSMSGQESSSEKSRHFWI